MSNIIEITVKDKIAETNFREVVSFNNVYRLKFQFDEEWDAFSNRVAVVVWDGGAAEVLFTGEECEMPRINTIHSEYALIGVYSVCDEKRISSSYLRLHCRAGTCDAPQTKPVSSLHEQILDRLNHWNGGPGSNKGVLSIGNKSYDGSANVTVTKDDLGLARVAISGSFQDLTDVPDLASGGVTSVNGKTGEVVITKDDLGLARVAVTGSFHDLSDVPDFASGSGNNLIKEVDVVPTPNPTSPYFVVSKNTTYVRKVYNGDAMVIYQPTPDYKWYYIFSIELYGTDKYYLIVWRKSEISTLYGKSGNSYGGVKDVCEAYTISTDAMVSDEQYASIDDAIAALKSYNTKYHEATENIIFYRSQESTSGSYFLTFPILRTNSQKSVKYPNNLKTSASGGSETSANASAYRPIDGTLSSELPDNAYEELVTWPKLQAMEVSSINGRAGEAMISTSNLGLGNMLNGTQMSAGNSILDGCDLNELTAMGFYHVRGTSESALSNAPASEDNASVSDARWCIMVMSQAVDGLIVQVAFSEREDCAVRIRNSISGNWGTWKTIL